MINVSSELFPLAGGKKYLMKCKLLYRKLMNEFIENVAYIKTNQIQTDQHYDICIIVYIQEKKENFSVIYTQNLEKTHRKNI